MSLIAATAVALTAGTAAAATFVYDIEALTEGETYVLFDVVNANGATMELRRFQWSNGTWTGNGIATVVESNYAAGSLDQELNLNNIMVRVIPEDPAIEAWFLYADLGGNVNLGVNGDHANVEDMIDLDGTVLGGCDIDVTEVVIAGGVRGQVTITPQEGVDIDMFGMGGQEFLVDDAGFETP